MRIKNIGKCLIVFSGGSLPVGKVAEFKGDAEKIGKTLLKSYPDRLMDLDNFKEEEIISVEPQKEEKEEVETDSKSVKKSKKSRKK